MKRLLRNTALLFAALALLLAGGAAWLLYTPTGARALLKGVSAVTPLRLEAGRATGRLADDLLLEKLAVEWPGGAARIESLRLLWDPAELLNLHLAVEELALAGAEVRLTETPEEPKPPPDLSFPEVPGFLRKARASLDRLRLDGLVVHPAGGDPTRISRLAARLRWQEGVFTLGDFSAVSPAGRVEGEGTADFVAPALALEFRAETTEPVQELDRFTIDVDLDPRPGSRRLAGPVELSAGEGDRERLRLEAQVDWSRERLTLPELRLFRPGEKGELTGRASVQGAEEWPFDLALRIAALDLAVVTGTETRLSGELSASGTTEGYRGSFSLANAASGWREGKIGASFAGTGEEIVLSDLEGKWLRGELRGELAAAWKRGWSVRGKVSARGLDPSVVTPEWPGRLNFDLAGTARGGEAPLQAQVEGEFRDSTLRGRPLSGEIDASLSGEELEIARFLLQGDGFDLRASGRVRERIDFRAEIPRLGGLVPGARGNLSSRGWVRWRDEHLSGALTARGRGVAVENVRVERFSVDAQHREKGAPFSVAADLRGVATDDLRVESAVIDARGSLEKHALRATATGGDVRLRFAARGGYSEGIWKGTVGELETGGRLPGRWTLASPAPVELSRERVRISSFRLDGPGEERLRVGADLAFSPRVGSVDGEWHRIDLRRANPWLEGLSLDGRSSGSLGVRWLKDGRLDLTGAARVAGSAVREGRRLTVDRGEVDLAWGPSGLKGALDADLGRLGTLDGRIASSQPAGGNVVPESGEGEVRWNLPDLAALSPFLPDVKLSGRSSGEARGRWRDRALLTVQGRAEMVGTVARDELDLEVRRAGAELDWNEQGLSASWSVDLGENGTTSGRVTSDEPPGRELPRRGAVEARWKGLDLSLLEPWLEGTEVAGRTTGSISARGGRTEISALEGEIALDARLSRDGRTLEIPRAGAQVRWDSRGLRGGWDVALAPQGRIFGKALSPEPARLALPERLTVQGGWEEIDIARFRPWLPPGLLLEGTLAGRIDGELLPERRLEVTGSASILDGELQWEGEDGILTASLRRAEVKVDWRDEALRGEAVLALQDYGRAEGDVQIPLPARLPVALRPDGALRGRLSASLREKGLLNALFPGLVQESRGTLSLDLRAGGSWENPALEGKVSLADAGAYLPAAGIRLQDARLLAEFSGEEVRISELRVRSGPGQIEGTGTVQLENWSPAGYRLQIRGKEFQAVNVPELRLLITPDLTVEGTREKVVVRGEIRVPDMLISGRETEPPLEPSPDVVVIDAPVKEGRKTPFAIDARVRVVLGEHVLVKAEGIDARLEGGVMVTMTGLGTDQITGKGEIRVAQGRYSAYGLTLDITRGVILFAGGPVDRPTLDILALRRIAVTGGTTAAPREGPETRPGELRTGVDELGERTIRAGVRVTGTPRNPEVKLYSEPSMPDTDILSYMVLGRPLGQGGGNAGLLMLAANQLLSRGESAVLQDRIKRTFGIDVLEVESGAGDTTGARVTVGKYLRPDLYISFGQSLFTNTQEVRLRYDLSKRWQLESSVGAESAVDLFYQIEFR